MRISEVLQQARRDGLLAGENAASWAFDDKELVKPNAAEVLEAIESGDNGSLDGFRVPDLSGEFPNDPTPQTLEQTYGLTGQPEWVLDQVCDAWMGAASEAYWDTLKRACKKHLGLE